MPQNCTDTPVLPFALPDCIVDAVRGAGATLLVDAHTTRPCQRCPACNRLSARVHSRYLRLVHDLPLTDRPVRLLLRVRRFFCDDDACPKRTFAERLPALVPYRARRTPRLTEALRTIGFATGGAAGARLAKCLRLRTSRDTLLRLLRAPSPPDVPPPHAVGLDDFALCKGRSYGTIVVDLVRRRPVDLLPDRTTETVAAWLRAREGIDVVARDRYRAYANAAAAGAPDSEQVVDRFHLLVNAREVVERYVHRVRPDLRRLLVDDTSLDSAAIDAPPPPRYDHGTARRQLQASKHTERERRFGHVKEAHARGLNLHQVARATGLSVKTVRLWVAADVLPPERRGYRGGGKVDPYGPYLLRRLAEGCTNQTLLWQEITAQGFKGTRSLVAKWIRARRAGVPTPAGAPDATLPGPQKLAWLVLRASDENLTDDERALWERLRQHDERAWVQGTVARFTALVRERDAAAYDAWLADCHAGSVPELRNFAASLEKDGDAVRAALTLPWSNGPTEGQINKLKLIKRSAYGRMKLDLLRQRVLHAA